jgi:hypothetical protein
VARHGASQAPGTSADSYRASNTVYRVYGLNVGIDQHIESLPCRAARHVDVTFARTHDLIRGSQPEAVSYEILPDGSEVLRWGLELAFHVAVDGRKVDYSVVDDAPPELFETYALNQALSFSLLRLGGEPLHANVVAIPGGAVALLGPTGAGKSTLGAHLLAVGGQLVTDDLLVLEPSDAGVRALPGMPRIKLAPQTARDLLPDLGPPRRNPYTGKEVLPVPPAMFSEGPEQLRRIYVLHRGGSDRITMRALTGRAALMALVRHTFNTRVVRPDRLRAQFEHAVWVVATVPMRTLSYPRDLRRLADVRGAIARDLGR